jgi:hypothetical protein
LRAIDHAGGVLHVLIALKNFKLSIKWGTEFKDSVVNLNKAFDDAELLISKELWKCLELNLCLRNH